MTFIHTLLVNSWNYGKLWEIKIKKIESADTIHSEIDRCRVLHERNNILFSFAEHINYKNKLLLHRLFEQVTTNQNKNPSIRTLNISNFLYTWCSRKNAITLVLSRSTQNFKKMTFTHSSWLNSCKSKQENQNRGAIHVEIAITWCSTKKSNHCFFCETRKISKKERLLQHFG